MMEPSVTVCPECGAEQIPDPVAAEIPVEQQTPLERFKGSTTEERAEWYRGVVEEASRNGYKLGFARRRYRDRYGKWPHRPRELEQAIYSCPVVGHAYEVKGVGGWTVKQCGYCLVKA